MPRPQFPHLRMRNFDSTPACLLTLAVFIHGPSRCLLTTTQSTWVLRPVTHGLRHSEADRDTTPAQTSSSYVLALLWV